MIEVRWSRGPDRDYEPYGRFGVPGRPPVWWEGDEEAFFAPSDLIADASLASLRRALRRCRALAIAEYGGTPRQYVTGVNPRDPGERVAIPLGDPEPFPVVQVFDVPYDDVRAADDYMYSPGPMRLVLDDDGELAVQFDFEVDAEEPPDEAALRRLLSPHLARFGARVGRIESHAYREKARDADAKLAGLRVAFWIVEVDVVPPVRGRTVGWLLERGRSALALLEAAAGREGLTASRLLSLIEGGHPDLLVGVRESESLDFKQALYSSDDRGRHELTKDVAAFANAAGGLIVVGARCVKLLDHEQVAALTPVALNRGDVQRYRAWLSHWVYPRIQGVEIAAWPLAGGDGFLTVSVPEQPAALKPFLVSGAGSGKDASRSSVAIPIRHGDDTVWVGREEFHATLVVGRTALRNAPDIGRTQK